MVTKIESFAKDSEETRLEEVVKTMKPVEAREYLEQEATTYLDMVFGYSSNKRLMQKAE